MAGEGMAIMMRVTPTTRGLEMGSRIRMPQVSRGNTSRRMKQEENTSLSRSRSETLPAAKVMPVTIMDRGVVMLDRWVSGVDSTAGMDSRAR